MLNQLLKSLTDSEQEIKVAKKNKTIVVDQIMNEIIINSEIFAEIWKGHKDNLKQKLQNLATKYSYKFSVSSNEKLNLHNLTSEISQCFPIFTYNEDFIFNSLPNTNEDWEIISHSTDDFIELEITPIDQNSRDYPLSLMEEDSLDIFVYKLPRQLHENTINVNKQEKTKLFLAYFNETINDSLLKIEEEIIQQAGLINKQISTIDFNNPAVVAALKNKLNI